MIIETPYTLENKQLGVTKGSVISRQMLAPRTTASSIEADIIYQN